MASKIRVLTDHTINKIAAGEVIENPASVVKELVENAIDAGAKDICVEIKGGGRQLIRISDDGCGMNADDALLCLERHATSKIREVEDIHSVTTMGFRGEAIPSIASISKFTLLTCPQEAPCSGTMLIVDAGKVVSCSPAARSPGTTVEVKSLFFNVPVRKKFLKSPAIDANEILKTLSLIALGYPNIKFQLISDNKSLMMTPLNREENFALLLKARIEAVLGQDFLQNTTFLKRDGDSMSLQGYVGYPNYTRHNRTGQHLFINHRGVFSPLVAYGIKEGYGTALPAGRHPVFVLHLTLCGSLVDVNVHPQKKEVRLRQDHLLKELIIKAVEQALQTSPHANQSFPEISPVFANAFKMPEPLNSISGDDEWIFRPKSFAPWGSQETQNAIIPPVQSNLKQANHSTCFSPSNPDHLSSTESSLFKQHSKPQNQPSLSLPKPISPPRVMATIPRYILLDGSLDNEFIAKGRSKGNDANKGGLFLIDQKAAHSRIIFEKLQQNEEGQPIPQQSLLIPFTVEVSSFEAAILRGSIPLLNQMGIQIKEFGSETFLIDAVPQVFGNSDLQLLISDILNALRQNHGDQPFEDEKNKRIALAASRAAVSHDRRLSIDEAQSLINQLSNCRQPYQCPQGKPILSQISPDELAKQFQKN